MNESSVCPRFVRGVCRLHFSNRLIGRKCAVLCTSVATTQSHFRSTRLLVPTRRADALRPAPSPQVRITRYQVQVLYPARPLGASKGPHFLGRLTALGQTVAISQVPDMSTEFRNPYVGLLTPPADCAIVIKCICTIFKSDRKGDRIEK